MMGLVKEVLARGDFAPMQAGALVFFVGLMLLVLTWIYWPGSKAYYDRVSEEMLRGDKDGI